MKEKMWLIDSIMAYLYDADVLTLEKVYKDIKQKGDVKDGNKTSYHRVIRQD